MKPAIVPAAGSKPQAPHQAANVRPPSVDRIAAAAKAGNPSAETIIGLRYLDGQGIAPDPAQALKWLQKAANAGQAVAQYRLGTMYERGQGVAASPAMAAKWYLAAANQGNRKAMHNLAVAYAEGIDGKKDMAEAARWFAKAAALGLSDSQFNLAVLYERGDGVPQSLIDAYKWYAIAAAQGDAESKAAHDRARRPNCPPPTAPRPAARPQSFHAAPLNRAANVPPEPRRSRDQVIQRDFSALPRLTRSAVARAHFLFAEGFATRLVSGHDRWKSICPSRKCRSSGSSFWAWAWAWAFSPACSASAAASC